MRDYLSVSQLNTYLGCPRQYAYVYNEEIEPSHVSSALILGSAVHIAASVLYLSIMERKRVKLREVAEKFCDSLLTLREINPPISYTKEENFNSLMVQGMGLIACLFQETPKDEEIVEVDYEINVPLRNSHGQELGLPLKCFLDKVVRLDGEAVVSDLKTSKTKYSDERISTDIQSYAYAYAMSATNGGGPIKFVWEVLIKNVTPKMQRCEVVRDTPDFDRFWAISDNILRGIEASSFGPNPSWRCKNCAFAYTCGDWGRG